MREVGYLNFEFDDLVDDIVANLSLQKHERNAVVLHRCDVSMIRVSTSPSWISRNCLTIHSITKKASIFFVVISSNHSVKII